LRKAVEDSNVFVHHISRIVARIKCENECRGKRDHGSLTLKLVMTNEFEE